MEIEENQGNMVKKEFLIYQDENEDVKVEVMLINDDLWLTQDLIAELFGKARNTITEHIKHIFEEGELDEKSNVGKTDIANSDKPVKIYNLNVIIAVGYRVNSKKATQFRIWATKILKEYMTKGFVLDDERLKKAENIFTMEDFAKSINEFLEFRRYDILQNCGSISKKQAEEKAEKEYMTFNKTQRINSDFDKLLLESENLKR